MTHDSLSQDPGGRTPNYKLRRFIAGGVVAGLAALGIKETVGFLTQPAPIEHQAKKAEESITGPAMTPEGLWLGDANSEYSPLSNVNIRLYKGVTLRSTPAIINGDPDAGIKSNKIPALNESGAPEIVTVVRPLQVTDRRGDHWYGFTRGPVMPEAEPDAAKATFWVNATELQNQQQTTGQHLIDIISTETETSGDSRLQQYLTYSPVTGYSITQTPHTVNQGINVAFADSGR